MEKICGDTYFLSELDQRLLGVTGRYLDTDELKEIDMMGILEDFSKRIIETDQLLADDEYTHSGAVRHIIDRQRMVLSMEAVALKSIMHQVVDAAEVSDFYI